MKNKERLVRRFIHSMTWIVLVYYLIPNPLFGYPRRVLLAIAISMVLIFEGFRLYFGFKVYGMRDYEERQLASYAWAAIAAAITLLFFPMHLAVVCLLGMGVVDPMIGELQDRIPTLYPYVPIFTWILLSILILSLLASHHSIPMIIIMSITGGVFAIIAEYPTIKIDDDFLMIITPLFVLRSMEVLLQII